MSLAAGSRLGPYEITAPIGAGGMGEVYKARDTRLDRSVAIKVLPPEFSADPDRRARFEREAKTIAGLNHPRICTLHDVGRNVPTEQAGRQPGLPKPVGEGGGTDRPAVDYLVMELLAGETLAQRLEKGRLPLEEALGIAAEVADALAAAHRQGIVHRDLKPGNVMLTKTGTKLLDFGLAKLTGHGEQPAAASLASMPTKTRPLTNEGAIVGTLQYMAPEQVEGKPADARTDLWALGAVLYEMLTGRRAFEGASAASLIGNIMNSQPPALATRLPLTPPSIDRLVRRCLAKVPEDRWQSAADIADELRWLRETAGTAPPAGVRLRSGNGRRTAVAVVAATLLVAMGAGLMWLLSPAPPPAGVLRLNLDPRPADEVNGGEPTGMYPYIPSPGGSQTALAWTPDGQAIVFAGRKGAVQQVYVRRLDAAEARPLAGTDGAQSLAVTPDGRWVVFWADGALSKVPLSGGPVVKILSNFQSPPVGLAWHPDGTLYFGRDRDAIWKLSADGALARVTTLDKTDTKHGLPHVLPGGKVLLFTVSHQTSVAGEEETVAQTLASGQRTVVLRDATDARYVPTTGHLVFMRQGVLLAAPFDIESLKMTGEEVPLLTRVAHAIHRGTPGLFTSAGQFDIASTGSLAWLSGDLPPLTTKALIAVNRMGEVTQLKNAPVRTYGTRVRLAPGGRELAVTVNELRTLTLSVFDLERGTLTPLLQDGGVVCPIWTPPDWRHLTFLWNRRGLGSVARYRADGTGAPEVLSGNYMPSSWTPDGNQLAAVGEAGIVLITRGSGQSAVAPWSGAPESAAYPEFSPDGRYIAYVASDSGPPEVYVAPYPGPGGRVKVSVSGGTAPAWRRDGRALFFIGCDDCTTSRRQRMTEVGFQPGVPPRIDTPRQLFEYDTWKLNFASALVRGYDVSPDGRQFYAQELRERNAPPPITQINVTLNWVEELKVKVPTKR